MPRFSDVIEFCRIDGWEELRKVGGGRPDHVKFRKVLVNGEVLRTQASRADADIGKDLWHHIWRDQLRLDSQDQFFEALRSRKPIKRSVDVPPSPPPGETIPIWLYVQLTMTAGLTPEEVLSMTREEAERRLARFYTEHGRHSE